MKNDQESQWVELDEDLCPCGGGGWADVNSDTPKECPIHYAGQLHPQSRALLLDDQKRLANEERRSQLNFRISEAIDKVAALQKELKETQAYLVSLELELINKTTTRKMEAMSIAQAELILDGIEEI